MDSKKILIIFVPVILLIFGYVYYSDYMTPTQEKKQNDTGEFADVKVARDTVLKNRLDRYKAKWEREKGLTRKVENEDDFFGDEIKKDSVRPSQAQPKDNEEFVVAEKPKQETKERIVYRDRPVTKAIEEQVKVVPEEKIKGKRFVKTDPFKGNMGGTASKDKADPSGGVATVSAKAIIHNDQKILSGGVVTMRLTEDLMLGTVTVPKNSFITGTVSFNDQRAVILVSSVSVNNRIYAAGLRAYDANDGIEGIYIPGGTSQDASKDVLNDVVSTATQSVNVPILGRTGQNVGRRKVNEPSVNFTSGYEIILKK